LKKTGIFKNYFGAEIALSDEISTYIFEELIKSPYLESIQQLTKANSRFMTDNRLYFNDLNEFRVAIYTGDFSQFSVKSQKDVYVSYSRINLFPTIGSGLDITNLLGGYIAGQQIQCVEYAFCIT
jgi:hypothetical protein